MAIRTRVGYLPTKTETGKGDDRKGVVRGKTYISTGTPFERTIRGETAPSAAK